MSSTSDNGDIQCKKIKIKWQQSIITPLVPPVGSYSLCTEAIEYRSCWLNVFVQGDLDDLLKTKKTVFLTVHDVGKTYLSFVDLVNHPKMAPLKERAVFLHISVPGQELGAKDVERDYPSMQQIGDGLAQVMEKLNLSDGKCIAIGEGAGADIACRFAMDFPQMVSGLVLIHCTSTTHGIIAHIKELFVSLRMDDGVMNHTSWNWLLIHKFGNHDMDEEQRQYVDGIKSGGMNQQNLSRYLYSFSHREDFTDRMKENLEKIDVLMVTGGNAPHNENVQHMFDHLCNPKNGMLVAESVVDVLAETPEHVASAIILVCHRHGLFEDVQLPVIKHISSDEISMSKEGTPHQKQLHETNHLILHSKKHA